MINLNPYNPRIELQPGDLEYEKLKYSIEEFGYVEPIVWNERISLEVINSSKSLSTSREPPR
jgi:ParB-like chromosome segregation protein Spo0J